MSQSYANLIYHIVFATKNREPLIMPENESRLYEYIGGGINQMGGIAISINGTKDHLHILARFHQSNAIADVLRDLKANATGWIHRVFPNSQDFAWQSGYAAFTVSESQVEKVRSYIANQKIHHRRQSFEQEFIALLEKHRIEFDEKYLWKA